VGHGGGLRGPPCSPKGEGWRGRPAPCRPGLRRSAGPQTGSGRGRRRERIPPGAEGYATRPDRGRAGGGRLCQPGRKPREHQDSRTEDRTHPEGDREGGTDRPTEGRGTDPGFGAGATRRHPKSMGGGKSSRSLIRSRTVRRRLPALSFPSSLSESVTFQSVPSSRGPLSRGAAPEPTARHDPTVDPPDPPAGPRHEVGGTSRGSSGLPPLATQGRAVPSH